MMEERNDLEKLDEVILPGFRFHPTDEELVGFYLKRKVTQRPLSIELIRQLNIYKYDPWDLPKLATTGEKEWYFYCPRDRKYRNSARPNRVTGAGFWKATGTDRPIYSSEGNKCIGLKKSLVFYKGRAAKGIKTEWMMHEFRLPSITDPTSLPKRPINHRNIPANDSWAICRIFKKTNSMAHRAISQSWVSPMLQTTHDHSSNIFSLSSTTTDARSTINFTGNTAAAPPANCPITTTQMEPNPYKPIDIPTSCFMYSTEDTPKPPVVDFGTMLMNFPSALFTEDAQKVASTTTASGIDFAHHQYKKIDFQQHPTFQPCSNNSFSIDQLPHVQDMMNGDLRSVGREMCMRRNNTGQYYINQWTNIRHSSTSTSTSTAATNTGTATGLSNSTIFPASGISDTWRSNLHPQPWDSPSCPSEMSANYSSKFAALD